MYIDYNFKCFMCIYMEWEIQRIFIFFIVKLLILIFAVDLIIIFICFIFIVIVIAVLIGDIDGSRAGSQ